MTTKVTNLNIDTSTITTVGTLTALTVSGNVTLGTVSNVHISGGTSGQVLSTDGSGNLSWKVSESGFSPFLLAGM
jgi:hypothetical protein